MIATPNPVKSASPVKVVIIDDSVVVRGMISRWIETESDIVLSGYGTDGVNGIEKVRSLQPDLVILDIEMPNMGGLEALPKLLAIKPGLKVLMASTLTQRGASITMKALELGASDYIPKPESARLGGAEGFRTELMAKIRALCHRRQASTNPPPVSVIRTGHVARASVNISAPRIRKIDALVVGSSTGGPPALRKFLDGLGKDWSLPIMIVQHMPTTFTAILADHLDKALPFTVKEAKSGEAILPKHVYIAPGDFHMTIRGSRSSPSLHLDQSPQVNWCRPAVDPLFKSAAALYHDGVAGVVLTGMGYDGREGARTLREQNAMVMVQDEATSVVWGMPGAVAEAGLAEIIKPIEGLSQACLAMVRGDKL